MISLGHHITTPNDPLQKVPVETIWHSILNPKEETASMIRQLRVVRNINPKQYSLLKRDLPYIVCGMFNPPYRKIDNFAYTEYFILDLDHLSEKNIDLEQLRQQLQQDSRIILSFASPSQDGLKLMFRLQERCFDPGVFTLFYKLFARQFSKQYSIDQVLDAKTCDVSRACFVSMDPLAHFNPTADKIDLQSFVDTEKNYDFFDLSLSLQQQPDSQQTTPKPENPQPKTDVSNDVIANIRAILNPDAKPKPEKPPAYVPHQLEQEMAALTEFIQSTGVEVTEIISIQYGKKIRTRTGTKMAETNVFYGKRGYSVVMTPRTGTNSELNEAVCQLIKSYFNLD